MFFRVLSQLPDHINSLRISQDLKRRLEYLKNEGRYTFTRVAIQALYEHLRNEGLEIARREVFPDCLEVLFVAPQERFHHNPRMEGTLRTASFLQFMGIETYLLDMSFEQDRELLEERINKDKNIGFVSMSNLTNPLGKDDYDSIFKVYELLTRTNNGKPRFVAGGRGAGFNPVVLLENTPLEIIFESYGSVLFGDMLLDSGYLGPHDTRGNAELFGNISGIVIKDYGKGGLAGRNPTEVGEKIVRGKYNNIENASFKVIDATINPMMINYRMLWGKNITMDVCAPYTFNPPTSLVPETLPESKSNIHPSDLYFQLRMTKVMSTSGSCTRRCKHCHYTTFSPILFVQTPKEFIPIYNRVIAQLPETEIVSFQDDDFLDERRNQGHLDNFLEALINHETNGRIIYSMETVPQEAQDDRILQKLKEAGFLTIMLGIENHVERAVEHTNKLREGDNFRDFITTPKKLVDKGFYARTSIMVFYPILKEEEFKTTVEGIIDSIDHRISVILFPFVMPQGGTYFASERGKCEVKKTEYLLPNGKKVNLDEIVLPEDPTLKSFSQDAVRRTWEALAQVKKDYGFRDTYPDQLEALAFLKSTINQWRAKKSRLINDHYLDELDYKVNSSLKKMAYRSKIQLIVRDAILNTAPQDICKLIENDQNSVPEVIFTLKQYLNFGHLNEISNAAVIYGLLLSIYNGDIKNQNMLDSLQFRAHHSDGKVSSACKTAIEVYHRIPSISLEGQLSHQSHTLS